MSKEAMKLDKEDITTAKEMAKVLRHSGKDELIVVGMLLDALLKEREKALAKQEQSTECVGEPAKLWCETCEGTGEVYQEHQANCHVGGHFKCPDCDGEGYIVSSLYSTTPQPKQKQGEPVVRYFEQWQASPLEEVDEERFNKFPESVRFKLYEAPQPAQKPLTDVLLHLFQEWKEDHLSQSNYIDAVEQIKAAHGIKGEA